MDQNKNSVKGAEGHEQEKDPGNTNAVLAALKSLFLHLEPGQRKRLIGLLFMVFVSALLDVFGIAGILPLIKLAADPEVIHSNPWLSELYNTTGFSDEGHFLLFIILSVLGFFIFKSAYGIFVNYLETRFGAMVAIQITRRQFNKYFNLDFHRFSMTRSSVITHHVLNNPLSYVTWVLMPLMMLISESFILMLIVTGIAVYDIKLLGFIAIIIGPAAWVIYASLRGQITRIGNDMNRLLPLALGALSQNISGYIDIKLAGREKFYRDKFLDHQNQYHRLNMASYLPNLIPLRANELVALLGVVIIFVYAILLLNNSNEAVVMVSLFAAAAYRLMPSINRIINSLMFIRKNQSSMHNLGLLPELSHDPKDDTEGKPIRFNDKIEIRSLSFRFPDAEKQTVKDLNMIIRKGEKIGIVGTSGSGKTTLMNLLLRFYKEQHGEIAVDGMVLTAEHDKSWRSRIGYVKQDVFLLDASIKDNITFGSEKVDPDRLRESIRMASLEPFVASLPEGIESQIGEKGSRLSGGQRQRISIARSLYRNADILVFDEATSALDNQTEQEVTESIDTLSLSKKTIFIIAHRITTLKNCDRIYELRDGELSGVYSYRELMEKVI